MRMALGLWVRWRALVRLASTISTSVSPWLQNAPFVVLSSRDAYEYMSLPRQPRGIGTAHNARVVRQCRKLNRRVNDTLHHYTSVQPLFEL